MKAFWWFKDNEIAGMGRPGFNKAHWFDHPFEEGVILGWLGRYSCGSYKLQDFYDHTAHYAPRIFKFYGLTENSGQQALTALQTNQGIIDNLKRLNARTEIYEDFQIANGHIEIQLNKKRLQEEIQIMKSKGVRQIVTLTEHHNQKEELTDHFDSHHISIEDLNAPKREQVLVLADILKQAKQKNEIVAVHCLAGIGRTSTMLMAASMHLGEDANKLEALLKVRNPTYTLTGPQGDFIRSLQKENPRTSP